MPPSEDRVPRHAKYGLFILLPVFFFLQTLAGPDAQFPIVDIAGVGALLVIMLGFQILLCHVVRGRNILHFALLASFCLLNIASLHILFIAFFQRNPASAGSFLLVVGLFVLYALFRMTADHRVAAMVFPAFVGGAIVATLLALVMQSPTPGPSIALPANVRPGQFAQKPNIYLISFDALVPRAIIKKYLNLDSVAYLDPLDTYFDRFTNAFANAAPTKPSLNRLLAFDPDIYAAARQRGREALFFSGMEPSPLLQTLKRQGYTTNTLHGTQFFGRTQGPHVDRYIAPDIATVCDLLDTDIRDFMLLGYCRLRYSAAFEPIVAFLGLPTPTSPLDLLLTQMRRQKQTGRPQFFLAYLFSPGHAPLAFDYADPEAVDDYRQDLLTDSRGTADDLEKIIQFVATEDPTAIVYVFGDHGMYLSVGHDQTDNKAFLVQDRLAVYSGIYPKGRCSTWYPQAYSGAFSTVNQTMNMILLCLSNGTSGFAQYPAPRIVDLPRAQGERYDAYLYE